MESDGGEEKLGEWGVGGASWLPSGDDAAEGLSIPERRRCPAAAAAAGQLVRRSARARAPRRARRGRPSQNHLWWILALLGSRASTIGGAQEVVSRRGRYP
ncbi:unnamed protein product [Prorocentrum cordatum]|uniref:Uncharacterized protein n=1 Tax=Prorocentrum cordatum TaxID=2364126 RepID=A0ABN9UK44_9DINO|nr:unnamed protein product [Polarella glacialis]